MRGVVGQTYVWGAGAGGKLGLGNEFDVKEPTALKGFGATGNIIAIAAAKTWSAAATVDGVLWTWGENEHGQLGHGDAEMSTVPRPVEALAGHRVTMVAVAQSHGACVTGKRQRCYTGALFTWGDGDYGRLGLGAKAMDVRVPQLVEALADQPVMAVSLGQKHSAAIAGPGLLYTWGAGGYGRLGHGDTSQSFMPKLVESLQGQVRLTRVALGIACSSAITERGVLFTWGRMGFGRCTADIHYPKATPREVFEGQAVEQIAFAEHHCAVVSDTGVLWTWGLNGSGQLGHGNNETHLVPKAVSALVRHRIKHVALGRSHTIAVTAEGKVFIWGYNYKGHLGHGDSVVKPQSLPLALDALGSQAIHALACGEDHTLAVVGTRPPGDAPKIVTQPPPDVAVAAAWWFELSVSVEAKPKATYQWYFNGEPMPDAKSEVVRVSSASPASSGTYTCIVSNVYGSVTARPTVVSVIGIEQWIAVADEKAAAAQLTLQEAHANVVKAGGEEAQQLIKEQQTALAMVETAERELDEAKHFAERARRHSARNMGLAEASAKKLWSQLKFMRYAKTSESKHKVHKLSQVCTQLLGDAADAHDNVNATAAQVAKREMELDRLREYADAASKAAGEVQAVQGAAAAALRDAEAVAEAAAAEAAAAREALQASVDQIRAAVANGNVAGVSEVMRMRGRDESKTIQAEGVKALLTLAMRSMNELHAVVDAGGIALSSTVEQRFSPDKRIGSYVSTLKAIVQGAVALEEAAAKVDALAVTQVMRLYEKVPSLLEMGAALVSSIEVVSKLDLDTVGDVLAALRAAAPLVRGKPAMAIRSATQVFEMMQWAHGSGINDVVVRLLEHGLGSLGELKNHFSPDMLTPLGLPGHRMDHVLRAVDELPEVQLEMAKPLPAALASNKEQVLAVMQASKTEWSRADAVSWITKALGYGGPQQWTSEDVVNWLHGLGFPQYIPNFKHATIDGPMLLSLRNGDLKQLGVDNSFHRRRLCQKILALGVE